MVRILIFFACKKEGEGGKPENVYGKICIVRKRYTKKNHGYYRWAVNPGMIAHESRES